MFLAGLELHLSDLAKNRRAAALAGSLGVLLPVILGIGTGELLGLDLHHSIYLGLILGATSVSISAQTLIELKQLRSRVGLGLLGAAVFDDILVILLLSLFLAFQSGDGGFWNMSWVILRMALFLGLSSLLGVFILPRLVRWVSRLPISQGITTLAIVILLFYGLAAEVLGGMAAITGAFLAGLMFARTSERSAVESGLHSLAYGLLVPVFFVNIGLTVNLRALEWAAFGAMALISLTAVVGKVLGAAGGARLGGFSWRESLQLGTGMISRGEVGLIVAKVGLDQNLLTPAIFSAIIGMVLVTTLVTPPLLRSAFAHPPKAAAPPPQESKSG
jgi:Kef-type K+ transport system membrane component KefB